MNTYYTLEANGKGWRGRITDDSGLELFTCWHCSPEGAEDEAEEVMEDLEDGS